MEAIYEGSKILHVARMAFPTLFSKPLNAAEAPLGMIRCLDLFACKILVRKASIISANVV